MVNTEERKARRFEVGLRPDLDKAVIVLRLGTYAEILQKAQLIAKDDLVTEVKVVERVLTTEKKTWNRNKSRNHGRKDGNKRYKNDDRRKVIPLCATCEKRYPDECYKKTDA